MLNFRSFFCWKLPLNSVYKVDAVQIFMILNFLKDVFEGSPQSTVGNGSAKTAYCQLKTVFVSKKKKHLL